MSEETKGKTPRLEILIDRSKELTEKDEKISELESKLSVIGDREFQRQRSEVARGLGISPERIENVDALKAYKKIYEERQITESPQAPQGGETAQLNRNQIEGKSSFQLDSSLPLDMQEFDNVESMVNQLKVYAKSGNEELKRESEKVLAELLKKQILSSEKGSSYELVGLITNLTKRNKAKYPNPYWKKIERE